MTTPVYVGSTTGPIPDATAWMLVTRTYSDGDTRQALFRWTDHTAASVRDYWRHRYRNHGVDHQWDGGDLITVRPASFMGEGVTVTVRRTFHDASPGRTTMPNGHTPDTHTIREGPDDLFNGQFPDPPEPEPDTRTSAQKRRDRQQERIAAGIHPLRDVALRGDGETCGTCTHRAMRVRSRKFPKCGLGPITGGPGTDVLASWPACEDWGAHDA